MGNVFPTPTRTQVENEEWLARTKKETRSTVQHWQTLDMAASAFMLSGHMVLKGTNHDLNSPDWKYVATGAAGALLGIFVLGACINNSYENTTKNPMNETKNRAVFGLFYATSLSVPVFYFVSWFVPQGYFLQALGLAAAVAAANVTRCVLVKPQPVPVALPVVAGNNRPAENPKETFFVDPVVSSNMPDLVGFSRGLDYLVRKGAIRVVQVGAAGGNMQGGLVGGGRNIQRGLVIARRADPARLFVENSVFYRMPDRETFVRGLQYLTSRDGFGILQHGVGGRDVYVPASLGNGGEEFVVQVEPRIVELDAQGRELRNANIGQGVEGLRVEQNIEDVIQVVEVVELGEEEPRNVEIPQEVGLHDAINVGAVEDENLEFVDAVNDPVNEELNV